jgi:hypothetical protein
VIRPTRSKEIQKRVRPIFDSLLRAMAAIASHYSAAELATIADFFTETTEVLHAETARLRRKPR